jgi:hypothetical protein
MVIRTYIRSFKTCTKNTSVFKNFHFKAFKVEVGHHDTFQGVMWGCAAAEPEVSTTLCAWQSHTPCTRINIRHHNMIPVFLILSNIVESVHMTKIDIEIGVC